MIHRLYHGWFSKKQTDPMQQIKCRPGMPLDCSNKTATDNNDDDDDDDGSHSSCYGTTPLSCLPNSTCFVRNSQLPRVVQAFERQSHPPTEMGATPPLLPKAVVPTEEDRLFSRQGKSQFHCRSNRTEHIPNTNNECLYQHLPQRPSTSATMTTTTTKTTTTTTMTTTMPTTTTTKKKKKKD